ncbi:AraC-type DNA-binding protein [Evansella caseinilytica]|uniref:AraC-type DNA-binding protein n=1 Tax=Evansella caseinilytica TaxID=1503961 RepID=A0A1H3NXI4_9BACI|nr:helix-turn-helix domain-containing protein [Evansella caseinilytica]SDY93528.1 AraC-type DNA-binding protein [Evansella caseinilytica]
MWNKSLLSKLIMFGCVISILPVIIVGTFSYFQSATVIQSKVNEEKVQLIRQINSNVEQVLKTVNYSFNTIIDSSTMYHALNVEMIAYDFQIQRELRKELMNLQSMETQVEDIFIINAQNNWLLNNTGVRRLNEHSDREKYLSFLDLTENSSWMLLRNSDFAESISKSDCSYTISLVKKLPIKRSFKYGLAFANIPACSIAKMINVDEDSEQFMIIDGNEQIIIHNNKEMIGKYLYELDYFPDEEFPENYGQFETIIDGKAYTVTYLHSDFNDWTYLSLYSIDALTTEAKKIGHVTVYTMLLIISISLAAVWLITRKIYSPVNKLVKYIEDQLPDNENKKENELELIEQQMKDLFSSNSDMGNQLKEHTHQVRALFLNRLFLGQAKSREIEEKISYFQLSDQVAAWSSLTVITLQIDTLDNSTYQAKDMELLIFAVTNIVEETIPAENRFPMVWMDQTLVCLVGGISDSKTDIETFIYDITEELHHNIEKWLNISVSLGISLPFRELKEAARAFQEGVEALKQRIKLGKGVIVHYSSVNSGKHSIIYDYPSRTEEELIVAIKIADKDKALQQLESWMEKTFSIPQSPREYQISMMRLLNNLLMVKQENGISFKQLKITHESLYEELLTLDMKEEIREWFETRLIIPLIHVFRERRNSQFQNLSEKIINLIHNHYDKDITLEECAAQLHYNANYLSSVFRQETNYTFSEYLANYRLKLAKQWLTKTEMTVKEIADKLRYTNSQNFIRSFKKLEKMTPGQYRQMNKV